MIPLHALALPLMFALMALEAVWSGARGAQVYERRDFAVSMSVLAGNIVANGALKGASLALYLWLHQFAAFDFGVGWWQAVLTLVAIDFVFYGFHRASHRVRFLWCVHVNHHSSEHMNFGTALRQPWLTPVVRPLFYWTLPLIGFDPLLTATMGSVATLYGFWTHTELIGKLGPLEWVLVTPSHHRAHHGSNPEYIDKNYANIFIVWDRIFGTFEEEIAPVQYGLVTNIDTFHPVRVVFHDWRALVSRMVGAESWWLAVQYAVRPPGWKPHVTALP